MSNLILHLEKKYFDQIKSGEKTEEYRQVNEYWSKRLIKKTFEKVVLLCGYPKRGDETKTIIRKWTGYTIKHEYLPLYNASGFTKVFAIDISKEEL